MDGRVSVVEVAGLYVCYFRSDHAFAHIMQDPRAREVSTDEYPISWRIGDRKPEHLWDVRGLDPLMLGAIHLWRHGIRFDHLDIGANVGLVTAHHGVLYRRLDWPTRIHAFEPGHVFPLLERTVALNGLADTITCWRLAVNDRTGRVVFHTTPAQSPAASLLAKAVSSPNVTERVPVVVDAVSIDDFLSGLPAKEGLIAKIDVEGADLTVLAGMKRTIEERICLVSFEFTPRLVEDAVRKVSSLAREFHILDVGQPPYRPVRRGDVEDFVRQVEARGLTDVLLVPRAVEGANELITRLLRG